jgi:hypothetical protein
MPSTNTKTNLRPYNILTRALVVILTNPQDSLQQVFKTSSALSVKFHHPPRPNPLPILPENPRHRRHNQRQKPQQTVSPPNPQFIIHRLPRKRDQRSQNRAQDRRCSHSRRSVPRIRIYEITLHWQLFHNFISSVFPTGVERKGRTYHNRHHPKRHKRCPNNRHQEICMSLCRPAIPK